MSTFKRCMYLKLTGLKSIYFPKNHVLFSLGGLFFIGPSLVLIHLDTLSLVHTATFVKKGSSSRPQKATVRTVILGVSTRRSRPPRSECHRWVERPDCVASRCRGVLMATPQNWLQNFRMRISRPYFFWRGRFIYTSSFSCAPRSTSWRGLVQKSRQVPPGHPALWDRNRWFRNPARKPGDSFGESQILAEGCFSNKKLVQLLGSINSLPAIFALIWMLLTVVECCWTEPFSNTNQSHRIHHQPLPMQGEKTLWPEI